MKKLFKILILLAAIGVIITPFGAIYAQTIVETDVGTGGNAFERPAQIKSWSSDGRMWVFWADQPADRVYMKSSPDRGDTWSSKTTILQVAPTMSIEGSMVALTYDGTNVHYIISEHTGVAQFIVRYRMGDPQSDGTIDWAAAEQTVTGPGSYANHPGIAVDSNGYPWVIYSDGSSNVIARKSSTKDGTWTNDGGAGSPWTVDTNGGAASIYGLQSGRMAAMWLETDLACRVWTGAGWDVEDTTAEDIDYYSAVAQDDDVHVAFLQNTSHDIEYTMYSYSGSDFISAVTLHSGATSTSSPVIQRNTSNNDLIVYWENHTLDDHVYYAQYVNSETTWYTDYDWINEGGGIPASGLYLNCDYTCDSGTAGLYYIAGTETLKYKVLDLPTVVATLTPSGVTTTSATLRGEVESLGSGTPVWRGFLWGTDPTLASYEAVGESGEFGVGVYNEVLSGLESDTLYYCKAYITDEYSNDFEGSIVGFLTSQASYESEEEEGTGNSTMIPPLTAPPGGPGGWIGPPKDWGGFGIAGAQIPYTFFLFLLLVALVVVAGFLLTKYTKSLGILFMVLGFILGVFCFYPRDGYLDWYVMFPYILVGVALIFKEQQYGWS